MGYDSESAAATEAVIPDEADLTISDNATEFVFANAANINWLIDYAGTAASVGDRIEHGYALSALFSFAFNLGVRFAEGQEDGKEE